MAILTHTPAYAVQQLPGDGTGSTPAPITNTVPAKPKKFARVYDIPGILNKDQYDRFHFDIGRMWDDGLPAVIFIRNSNDATQASQDFADTMRDTWNIESAPGADDGLVMLVTIRERFPHTAILSLSYGANAFPQGQMTIPVLDDIMEREVLPRIRTGLINDGMTYAVRRILYYSEYTAPFPAPLSNRQETLHSLALPVAAIVTIALLALIALPKRYLPNSLTRRISLYFSAGFLVFIAMVFAVSGQHTLASGIALLDLGLFLVVCAVHSWRNQHGAGARKIRQTHLAVRARPSTLHKRSVRRA